MIFVVLIIAALIVIFKEVLNFAIAWCIFLATIVGVFAGFAYLVEQLIGTIS